ncbi:MAG: hypothetical protein JWR59_1712 [Brevundimonas sp.]|nr:hypothetical protein [Brevundimonas sp.]
MRNTVIVAVAALAVLAATSASAQTPEPVQTPPAAEAVAVPAATSEDWNAVSRSATRVYLVDVNSIKANGGVSAINLARVPLNAANPADHSYTLVAMEFRCASKESRAVTETDHDEAGAALDPYTTGEEFSPYSAEALDGYIAAVVCDSARGEPPTFPSIAAFIDAGRPGARR